MRLATTSWLQVRRWPAALLFVVAALCPAMTASVAVAATGSANPGPPIASDAVSATTTSPVGTRTGAFRGYDPRGHGSRSRSRPSRRVLATKAPPRRPDFIADQRGTAVPTSQSRMRQGLEDAGFPSQATQAPGRQFTFPDGSTVRLMAPSGQAGRWASFENPFGGPISPFTGKPVQAPGRLPPGAGRDYVRSRTHVEQGP